MSADADTRWLPRSLEWGIAWRHLRANEVPMWARRAGRLAALALLVGGGMLAWAAREASQAGGLFSPEPSLPTWAAVFGGMTVAIAAMVMLFAAFARWFSALSTIVIFEVLLGCMALVIVLSLMSGLEGDLRDKILGQKAHIRLSHRQGDRFSEYESLVASLSALPGVVGVSPYLEGEVMVRSGLNRQGAVLYGVVPERLADATNLRDVMVEGQFEALADPASIPAFDPFDAPFRDETPFRLRHLEDDEDARRLVPRPTLLVDDEDAHTGTTSAPSEDNPDAPRGRPALRSLPAPIFDASGEEDDGWEDPVEVLDLPPESGDTGGDGEPPSTDAPATDPLFGVDEPILDPLLIGREMAVELAVHVGARVQLITPVGRMTPAGRIPGVLAARVGGVFYSGWYEADRKNVYAPLPVVQAFLRAGDRISGIEIRLADVRQLHAAKVAVERVVSEAGRSDELVVETWEELNRNLFSAMFLEKVAMFIALLFVVLVASFGILASNLMSVLERSKEIAILKAMGGADALVRRIFIAEGLCVGLIGAMSGIAIGLTLCWVLDAYGLPMEDLYIEKLPIHVEPLEVVVVVVAVMIIVALSSLYPATVAARTRPVDGLRHAD